MRTTSLLKGLARRAGIRRSRIASLRTCCERAALATLYPRRVQSNEHSNGRILCYHSVGTPQWGVNDVTPTRFRRQLELALRAGYRFVSARDLARGGGSSHDLAITFDDGLMTVATNAAPVLAEYCIPWTMFVVTDWADGRHTWDDGMLLGWREIERAAARGATVGSHSVSHPNFGRLSANVAMHELLQSRQVIEARTGIRPTSFAVPFGQSRDWTAAAQEAADEAGYEFVYAQSVNHRVDGTVPRTFITRFDNDQIFHAALSGSFDDWEESV